MLTEKRRKWLQNTFYMHLLRLDGYRREQYLKRRDKELAYQKNIRKKGSEGHKKYTEYMKKWRVKNKEKVHYHNKRNAEVITDALLIRDMKRTIPVNEITPELVKLYRASRLLRREIKNQQNNK